MRAEIVFVLNVPSTWTSSLIWITVESVDDIVLPTIETVPNVFVPPVVVILGAIKSFAVIEPVVVIFVKS